jgi:hypothetical protein
MNIFSSLCLIYSGTNKVGSIKLRAFSGSATGELQGRAVNFVTRGFLRPRTSIIDAASGETIGEITYQNWMKGASITINNKLVNWKHDNFWNTRWTMLGSEGTELRFSGSATSGCIDSSTSDPVAILSGLFVKLYFWQKTIFVVIAANVPIWVAIAHRL